MDFQKELSINAKNPQELERQARQEADQRMREQAQSLAKEICQQIKMQLLEKVKHGKYTQEYNKGTVTCHVDIPGNRYLKVDSHFEYNKKTFICTRACRSFLIEQETRAEYTYLQDELNAWGQTEQIKISWVVMMRNSTYERAFPSSTPEEFPPNTYPVFQLAVKAVSHFPVDPSLPMDHMTENDILDMHKKLDQRIDYFEKVCLSHRQSLTQFSFGIVCSIAALILFAWLEAGFFILCSLAAIFFFGVLAYDAYSSYEKAKATLTNERNEVAKQKADTTRQ